MRTTKKILPADTRCRHLSLFDTYLDVQELLSEDWRAHIDGVSGSVERSSEHFNTDGHAQDITGELYVSVQIINA